MIFRPVAAIAALSFVAACAIPPQGVTQEDVANFDIAVASIGCDLVSESDYLPVEFQTGLTREQVIQTAQYRVSTEDAVALEGGGVRLVTGACAPDAT
ncbi:NADH dehydrogenase [Marivita hallyeonensis]|uniref:NADH dehydrogenase n=1 Tax=Marivita hallyeonensis TaxID=996342 RepID=A0A1M5RJU6_9RHOB|nr:NADH dehydrogenase [Marivita hallyeonensis]SHH26083.1 hypothetical protein SAMN05443551_1775 [Marivita hallyeonensis]